MHICLNIQKYKKNPNTKNKIFLPMQKYTLFSSSLPIPTAFYRNLPHFTDSYRFLPILTAFYRNLRFLTDFYRILPKLTD